MILLYSLLHSFFKKSVDFSGGQKNNINSYIIQISIFVQNILNILSLTGSLGHPEKKFFEQSKEGDQKFANISSCVRNKFYSWSPRH